MATPGKASKKQSKRIISKTSLNSPFQSQWRLIPQVDQLHILKKINSKLLTLGLKKKEVSIPRRNKKARTPCAPSENTAPESQYTQVGLQDLPYNGWTDNAARRQLAIGINEVTKALERNELRLVLVCSSVRPQQMTHHLIALSATRRVPAGKVAQFSKSVSDPLGLKSVLALGFKRCRSTEDDIFGDLIDAIIPKVPFPVAPWLQGTGLQLETQLTVETVEGQNKRGPKRKWEETEITKNENPVACILQPLVIKRIVPNPSKNRIKKKKSKKHSSKQV